VVDVVPAGGVCVLFICLETGERAAGEYMGMLGSRAFIIEGKLLSAGVSRQLQRIGTGAG